MTSTDTSSPRPSLQRPLLGAAAILGILAAVKLLVHLLTAANYGLFGDELYFLAAGEHLDWGYVDMPPLTAVQAWLARSLFGESVFSIHLFPALLGAGLMLLTGLIVYELGGRRFAQTLAGLAVLIASVYLYVNSYLSMNSVEPLIWIGCAWMLIRMIKAGNTKLWLAFGALAGLGLLNKHTIALFGAALVAGLLLTPARKLLRSKWFLVVIRTTGTGAPRDYTGESILLLGEKLSDLKGIFAECQQVGMVSHPYAMPRQRFPIYWCRGLKQPLREAWPAFKNWS